MSVKKNKLKDVVFYSSERGNYNELDVETYVTTDNLLQDKSGLKKAVSLPLNGKTFPKYKPDDILVSNIRPYLKKIWYSNREGICSSDVLTFSVNKAYLPKFIYYNLFRDEFFDHMMHGAKGTKMPRGDKKQILEYEIPDFPFDNQLKIASILTSIDEKIKLNNKINDNLFYKIYPTVTWPFISMGKSQSLSFVRC